LSGLSRIYQRGAHSVYALREIDLTINEGEFAAIVGRSGSGKSFLLNIIGFLDSPSAGTFEFEGLDVSTLDADRRAIVCNQKIGFVFQSYNLLARNNARENVEVPLICRGLSAAERRLRAPRRAAP